jgi:tetratricopeptide (TPR) repeat protein
LALARTYIEKSRAESDPRYLGFAQATLNPWWNLPQPPIEVLVLRATIRQSTHDFKAALADLDLALKADPTHAQAWLTRAVILQVRGDYEAAKKACLPLFRLTSELVTVTCASSIASLNGEASKSYELLRRVYESNPSAASNERLWCLTVMAEIATRLGRAGEAESHFNEALALAQRDGYLLGAYADFLLDRERASEVINLLQNETRSDGLLLRLALAENAVTPKPPGIQQHIASLRDRFSASRQRGDTVHRREEARFTLHLLHEPKQALRLALENWSVQCEPSDARVLLESALAAKDFQTVQPVLSWLEKNRLEDVHLSKLANQLRALR